MCTMKPQSRLSPSLLPFYLCRPGEHLLFHQLRQALLYILPLLHILARAPRGVHILPSHPFFKGKLVILAHLREGLVLWLSQLHLLPRRGRLLQLLSLALLVHLLRLQLSGCLRQQLSKMRLIRKAARLREVSRLKLALQLMLLLLQQPLVLLLPLLLLLLLLELQVLMPLPLPSVVLILLLEPRLLLLQVLGLDVCIQGHPLARTALHVPRQFRRTLPHSGLRPP